MSQSEYKENPEWKQDSSGTFHRIEVNYPNEDCDAVIKWIYVIEDDSFEDGTVAMDVTDKVEQDKKNEDFKVDNGR